MSKCNTYGLLPRNHPVSVRWKVDQDYVKQLSEEDRAYLAEFNDRFYGADFRGDAGQEWSPEERRVAYSAKNTANTDIYPGLEYAGILESLDGGQLDKDETPIRQPPVKTQDESPLPAYLNSSEYRTALEEYRKHLCQNRKNSKPKETAAFLRAKKKLEKIIKKGSKP